MEEQSIEKRIEAARGQGKPTFYSRTTDNKPRSASEIYGDVSTSAAKEEMDYLKALRAAAPDVTERNMTPAIMQLIEASKERHGKIMAKRKARDAKRDTGADDDGTDAPEERDSDEDNDAEDEDNRSVMAKYKAKLKKRRYSNGVGFASVDVVEAASEWRNTGHDYSRQGSESSFGGQDNHLISQIAPFLGAPTKGVPKNSSYSHSYESHELPDAFLGVREYNRKIIFNGLMEDDDWYLTEASTLKQKDDLGDFVWDKIVFDNHLLGRVPYLGIPDVVANRRYTKKASMVKFGLGQEVEGFFHRTAEGRLTFTMGQEQLRHASKETLCLGVLTELLVCRSTPTNAQELDNLIRSRQSYEQNVIQPQCDQWDSMRKGAQGPAVTAQRAKTLLRRQGTSPDNCLFIVPMGVSTLISFAPDHNNASVTGVAKPNFDPITNTPTIAGVRRVRESRAFRMGRGKEDYDPLWKSVAIGSHFTMRGTNVWTRSSVYEEVAKYQTDQMDIYRYRASQDEDYRESYASAVDAIQYWTNDGQTLTSVGAFNLAKKLTTGGGKSYDHPCWHLDETKMDEKERRDVQNKLADAASSKNHTGITIMNALDWYDWAGASIPIRLSVKAAFSKYYTNATFQKELKEMVTDAAHHPVISAVDQTVDEKKVDAFLEKVHLTTNKWFKFALKWNIILCLPIQISVPNIVWKVGTSILVAPDACTTYVGFSRYSIARNAIADQYLASFSLHAKSIADGDRVARDRNSFVRDYESGDNGVYWKSQADVDSVKQNGPINIGRHVIVEKTQFAFGLPPGYNFPQNKFNSLTGVYPMNAVQDISFHRPSCAPYNKHWGFDTNIHNRGLNSNEVWGGVYEPGKHNRTGNILTAHGRQCEWEPTLAGGEFRRVTLDSGHKGPDWGPHSIRQLKESTTRIPSMVSIAGKYVVPC